MRQFDLSYSIQNGRVTFKALNENGQRAMWEVLSLMESFSENESGVNNPEIENVLKTLKRKGYTVRYANRKR